MWQQLSNLACPLRWQARENILQVRVRIMPIELRRLNQTHDCSRTFAAA